MIGDWVYFLFILLIGLWPEDMPTTTQYRVGVYLAMHCKPLQRRSDQRVLKLLPRPRAHCLTIESRRP